MPRALRGKIHVLALAAAAGRSGRHRTDWATEWLCLDLVQAPRWVLGGNACDCSQPATPHLQKGDKTRGAPRLLLALKHYLAVLAGIRRLERHPSLSDSKSQKKLAHVIPRVSRCTRKAEKESH